MGKINLLVEQNCYFQEDFMLPMLFKYCCILIRWRSYKYCKVNSQQRGHWVFFPNILRKKWIYEIICLNEVFHFIVLCFKLCCIFGWVLSVVKVVTFLFQVIRWYILGKCKMIIKKLKNWNGEWSPCWIVLLVRV